MSQQTTEYWISFNNGRPYKVAYEQYQDLRVSCAGSDSDTNLWTALTPGSKTPIRGWVEPQPNVARLAK